MQTEHTDELAAALAKAQGAMEAAKFDKQNPHFRNKYASLAAVIEAIRKPLADNGLAYTQATEIRENGFVLLTTLRHASGQWITSEYPLPMGLKPQELGSALSYARRYSLSAIVCISADEDDDAEGARKDGQTNSKPQVYARTPEEYAERTKADLDRDDYLRNFKAKVAEAGPHMIVEDDNMRWGAKFVIAIKAAKTDDEITQWMDNNRDRLETLALDAPKIHDRVLTNVDTASDALKRSAA